MSIRERNIALHRAIVDILEIGADFDWLQVRREMTDDKIRKIYGVFDGLWPLETDIFELLPKPDGKLRAVFSGIIHPKAIYEVAVGAPLFFGETIVAHPFIHPAVMQKDYSPIESPGAFRNEILKAVHTFMQVFPLVERGLINLVPDPCEFDQHLREQMHAMAKDRTKNLDVDVDIDPRVRTFGEEDGKRMLFTLPSYKLLGMMKNAGLEDGAEVVGGLAGGLRMMKEHDPLTSLQEDAEGDVNSHHQLSMLKMSPNFEMSMMLAQATGALIVTDNLYRWEELQSANVQPLGFPREICSELRAEIESCSFQFPVEAESVCQIERSVDFTAYSGVMRATFKYLQFQLENGRNRNKEKALSRRFVQTHTSSQNTLTQLGSLNNVVSWKANFPHDGIRDNNVNRLLLMSGSKIHLRTMPMAIYVETSGQLVEGGFDEIASDVQEPE